MRVGILTLFHGNNNWGGDLQGYALKAYICLLYTSTIYSKEARVQLRKVLDDFKPDVCHLNNFNYQLTPVLPCCRWS